MKSIFIVLFGSLFCLNIASAQDDLLNSLENSNDKADPVSGMFKGNRLLNGQTTETVAKSHLDFKIHHRFGKINDGPYNFFGLDQAYLYLGFDYGISDKLTLGISRNNEMKLFTGSLKYKILTQTTKGKNSKPLSLTYYTNIGCVSLSWADQGVANRTNLFTSRLSFTHQLLIARKFGPKMSLQLMPTLFHQNLVKAVDQPNDLYLIGMGGSFKLNRSTRFNIEYYPVLNRYSGSNTTNPLSIGFDIETGGHVFQLVMSNSRGMVENLFIPNTTGKWTNGDIYFGFNILRYFKLGKSKFN